MISAFSHIYLPTRDIQESIDFYTNLLGFELFRSWEMNGRRSAYCKLNGVLLELTLRDNTERPITVDQGTNTLVGRDRDAILRLVDEILATGGKRGRVPELWDGHAAERIAAHLERHLAARALAMHG